MQRRMFLFPLVAAGLAYGQVEVTQMRIPAPPPPPGGAEGNVIYFDRAAEANLGTMEFVRSEFGSGTVVKNAPYTAEAVTESVQVLQDGNRIVHKDAVTLARDSEGRTRRDMTMPVIPGMSASDAPRFSFVFDPATNTSYTFNHNSRTANKTAGRGYTFRFSSSEAQPSGAKPAAVAGGVVMSHENQVSHVMKFETTETGPVSAPGIRIRTNGKDPRNSRTEDLGSQTMEGVAVQGSRTVTTIEAGAIGNERPIEIVSERWYSPELQMVVMSKHSDPRSGETTYRLTNLRREAPAKSLFEVPAGYTMEANENRIMRFKQTAPRE